MSWWISLEDDDGQVEVSLFEEGGTYPAGGIDRAELNVTYNYGPRFRRAWPDALGEGGTLDEMLDGKAAKDTQSQLKSAIKQLGTNKDEDYWNPTSGNAGHALNILLEWAKQHPNAVWRVN